MKGDKSYQLFEDMYRNYAGAIFRFVYLKVSDRVLAQDITAETFIRLWKLIKKNTQIKNQRALVYFIARGLVVDYYRSYKNRKNLHIDEVAYEIDDSAIDLIEEIFKKQEMALIYAALKNIKQEYKEVILLRYVEDLTVPEIATIIGKNENAVRVLIHRAIQTLKKKL